MRVLMMVAAVAAVSACNRGGSANNASGNHANAAAANTSNAAAPAANVTASTANAAAPAPASSFPANFPAREVASDGVSCIVFLGLSRQANSTAVGFDDPIMQQAQGQWEAALAQEMAENEWKQLVGSSVNPLTGTPAAQRDAASRWCVENAPEVDPEG